MFCFSYMSILFRERDNFAPFYECIKTKTVLEQLYSLCNDAFLSPDSTLQSAILRYIITNTEN